MQESHGLVHREISYVVLTFYYFYYGLVHDFSCIRTAPYQVQNGWCVAPVTKNGPEKHIFMDI